MPRRRVLAVLLLAAALTPAALAAQDVPAPRSVLGFEVGADRTLADWGQITGYFTRLAAASPAVRVDTLGRTTNGLPFVVATITSPANMRRLDEIRAAQARLADPRRLDAAEEARLLATQPTVVFISSNIHATEIASSQMAMELAHRLVTNDTLRGYLEHTVVLLAPSMNPDGQQMITEWYRRNLGTRWEGGPLPWLYHPYTGHDNNRDWFMVTQRETRLVTDFLYGRWFPEIFYDVHQMGNEGARIFVPPMVDPVNPNLDPLIVRAIGHIGYEMALALEERGKSGVANSVIYDLWWHGGARSTPTRHNMVGVISEAASVRIATPIVQDTSKLRGHARGLPTYERRTNFPNPWPGGTWRLRDIVDYELIAAEALVRLAAEQREQYVRNFVALGRRAVERGRTEAPFAFVIPAGQPDRGAVERLVDVLRVGRVEVERATAPFRAGAEQFAAGSYVVRLAQPYRAHAKDLLEVQRFPKMEQYPGGPPERPYDVAGWTLPLQMGVRVVQVDSAFAVPTTPLTAPIVAGQPPAGCPAAAGARPADRRDTESYRCPDRHPRVALYRSWTASMDEGWTRWVLDDFRVPYTSLTDSAVKAGRLRDRFDVVVVPDLSLRQLRDGMSPDAVPAPYAGGLGETGIAALRRFAEEGGRLVLVDGATELAPAALGVDVRLVTTGSTQAAGAAGEPPAGPPVEPLYAPGSILRVHLDTTHAVNAGMPASAAVYFINSTAFELPAGSAARVIARYPERADDILLSGFLQGASRLAGRAAALEATVGRGRVVLFGFRPLYRAQSYGTFRMFFNALLGTP
jgi:hypothetical protein